MNSEANEESERRKYKYRATAFLLGVAGNIKCRSKRM